MKVFLCGGGSGEVVKESMLKFGSLIDKNKPLLYLPLAMETERYAGCLEWIKKELSIIGISNIDMVTSGKELYNKNLNDYCAIFIGGGNTYRLLKEIKDSNSFDKISDFIKNDGIVFGGSAGAIIFGKDINSCKSQDLNTVCLTDTCGFNILSGYSLLCHLNRNDGVKFNRDKNSEYLMHFSKNNKVLYIPDDDTIFINDKDVTFIGDSEYRIYYNNKFIVKKPSSSKIDLD